MINVNQKIENIARLCHEANRVFRIALGETPGPNWDSAPEEMKDSTYIGVLKCLDGNNPEQLHESWLEERKSKGWTYGYPLDREKKIHPNLVPYEQLDMAQKLKDDLFMSIVKNYRR